MFDASTISVLSMIVSTGTAVVVAYLTWRNVRLTHDMVESMKSARDPFVDIQLDIPEGRLRLAFVNQGATAARNIRFVIEQDCDLLEVHGAKQGGVASMTPFKNGITYMPAGQRLLYEVGDCPRNIEAHPNPFLAIQILFEDEAGQAFTRRVQYDLRHIENLLFESFQDPNKSIAKAIRDTHRDSYARSFASQFRRNLE